MKNSLIISGKYNQFLEIKKNLYLLNQDFNSISPYLELFPDMYNENVSAEEIEECFKIFRANKQRKYNNWNEICKWCYALQNIPAYKDYKLVFGTLTFNDESLSNLSERTRARYVTAFLRQNTNHYIANIDYGDLNNREHYHFLAIIKDKIDMSKWSYGGNKIKIVKMTKKDIKRTKNYLLKLNNHSYKASTKQKRIIRDRNEDKIIDYFIDLVAYEDFRRFKLLMNSYE